MQEAREGRAGRPTLKDRVEAFERGLIVDALAATAGNQRQAAFQLGVLPTTLHEKMKRLGMVPRVARPRGTRAPVPSGSPEPFVAVPAPA